MKTLRLYLYFNLPEDFNGSREEAIELFLKHYKNTKKRTEIKNDGTELPEINLDEKDSDKKLWQSFLKERQKGYKYLGFVDVAELKNKKMVSIYKKD